MSDAEPAGAGYAPIACDSHDALEHWAIRGATVEVVWCDDDKTHRQHARIADVFAHGGADWLRLESGETIRADRLVSVGGVMMEPDC